jgi:hypothetical protein
MTTYNLNSYLNGRCYHFDSIFRANSYVSQGKSVKKFNILYTEALWIRLHLDRSALQMIETSGGSLVKDDANPVTILYPFSYIKTVSNIHFKKRYLKRLN